MLMHEHRLQVLTILSANLHNPHPQLVSTALIAGKIDIRLAKLQRILSTMDAMGLIQTNADLQYSLITRKGLNYLSEQPRCLSDNFASP